MAKADSRRRTAAPADALADLREHVEEDEAEEERLDQHPDDELDEVLAQHHQVAEDEGPEGDAAGVERRTGADGSAWPSAPVVPVSTVLILPAAPYR